MGMSTVTEALTAAHCGLPCLGFSVITNMAAGILDQPLTDEEVNEVGHLVADNFREAMANLAMSSIGRLRYFQLWPS